MVHSGFLGSGIVSAFKGVGELRMLSIPLHHCTGVKEAILFWFSISNHIKKDLLLVLFI